MGAESPIIIVQAMGKSLREVMQVITMGADNTLSFGSRSRRPEGRKTRRPDAIADDGVAIQ